MSRFARGILVAGLVLVSVEAEERATPHDDWKTWLEARGQRDQHWKVDIRTTNNPSPMLRGFGVGAKVTPFEGTVSLWHRIDGAMVAATDRKLGGWSLYLAGKTRVEQSMHHSKLRRRRDNVEQRILRIATIASLSELCREDSWKRKDDGTWEAEWSIQDAREMGPVRKRLQPIHRATIRLKPGALKQHSFEVEVVHRDPVREMIAKRQGADAKDVMGRTVLFRFQYHARAEPWPDLAAFYKLVMQSIEAELD